MANGGVENAGVKFSSLINDDVGEIFFSLQHQKEEINKKNSCCVFHCLATEKPSIPLLRQELYYVLIIQNYQPALNSSRLHCLCLMWLI